MKIVLIAITLFAVLTLLIIVCIAWTHAPFTFSDFLRDFLVWTKQKPK